jgi:hypothetical protein
MKLFTKLLASAIFIAPLGLADAAAAFTSYNNSSDYIAAAGNITTISFAGCGNATVSLAVDATLGGSGVCSGLPNGIDFAPSAGGQLYIAQPGQSSNPTIALGLDNPTGGVISFSLASLTTSFAAQFFQNFGGGEQSDSSSYTVLFYNDGAQFASSTFGAAANGGTFYGVTGLNPFNRITISQAGGYAVIDDVSFGSVANVVTAAPEPATWSMLLLGFGAAGFAMRRASRRPATATIA